LITWLTIGEFLANPLDRGTLRGLFLRATDGWRAAHQSGVLPLFGPEPAAGDAKLPLTCLLDDVASCFVTPEFQGQDGLPVQKSLASTDWSSILQFDSARNFGFDSPLAPKGAFGSPLSEAELSSGVTTVQQQTPVGIDPLNVRGVGKVIRELIRGERHSADTEQPVAKV
jgi:hypothetical protein